MFDSCLRLAPNHLLPLAFCVSKRTLRSTREGFFYLLSPPVPSSTRPFSQPRHGKGPYLHRCAPITLPDKLANPFLRPSSSSSSRASPSSVLPPPPVKSRDNALKNPFFLPYFEFRFFSFLYFISLTGR